MEKKIEMEDYVPGAQATCPLDEIPQLILDNFGHAVTVEVEHMMQSIANYLTIKTKSEGEMPFFSESSKASESGDSQIQDELCKAQLLIRILNASASITKSILEMQAEKQSV